jgi:hypothetical protein
LTRGVNVTSRMTDDPFTKIPRQPAKSWPDGWQPRSDVDEEGGTVITRPYTPDQPPEHATILQEFGLDPDRWTVVSVRRSRWQTYDERWLEAQRLSVQPRSSATRQQVDYEQLSAEIAKWRPRTSPSKVEPGTFCFPIGDTQLGKSDGDGTPGTVRRFLNELERQVQVMRQAAPRKKVQSVMLPWLGDCIEGIWSQNRSLRARLDLTVTEQVRTYRRLMWKQVQTFAPLCDRLVIPVVPGNHDEAERVGDKMSTVYDDSWAVEGAAAVHDLVRTHDDLGHVQFVFPRHDELTVTLEHDGLVVGMAHGHQFGRDVFKWWNDQAGGRTDIGHATLLLAAHKHHLRVQDHGGGRLFVQVPALDGGSQWFKHRYGDQTRSRTISFWIRDGQVTGLDGVS